MTELQAQVKDILGRAGAIANSLRYSNALEKDVFGIVNLLGCILRSMSKEQLEAVSNELANVESGKS